MSKDKTKFGDDVLLSIVVPTRNRVSCAEHLIEYLLSFNEPFELVVSDNSDTDLLKVKVQEKFNQKRLKYFYTNDRLSVVDNFNQALANTTGRYVLFLGDDDSISPRIFDYVKSLERRKVDAVVFGRKKSVVHYFWPGVKAARWGDIGGTLYFSDFSGEEHQVDLDKVVRKAIFNLGNGPQEMPRAYLGIISRKVIQDVNSKYGPLFGGVSPDVYSSFLISSVAKRVLRLDYPMIVPGASPESTSAQRAERSDVGSIGENDHTGRFKEIDWFMQIPKYYSPFTVWALSLFQATQKTCYPIPMSGFANLYALCLLFTRGHVSEVMEAMRFGRARGQFIKCFFLTLEKAAKILFFYVFDRIPTLIRQKPGGARFEIVDFSCIGDAVKEMEKKLAHLKLCNGNLFETSEEGNKNQNCSCD